jgi:hypothetical protein
MGDGRNEGIYEVVDEIKGVQDPCMESHFEYGTRVGYWHILRLLDDFGVQATFTTCARAIEHALWMALEAIAAGARSLATDTAGKARPTWRKPLSAR